MPLTITQPLFNQAIEMALDKAALAGTDTVQAVTSTPTEIIAGFDVVADGELSVTTIASGRITAGRGGTAIIRASASFTLDASADVVTIEVYLNGSTGTDIKMVRKIATASDEGSAACEGILTLADTNYIQLKVSKPGASTNVNFASIGFSLEWQA